MRPSKELAEMVREEGPWWVIDNIYHGEGFAWIQTENLYQRQHDWRFGARGPFDDYEEAVRVRDQLNDEVEESAS